MSMHVVEGKKLLLGRVVKIVPDSKYAASEQRKRDERTSESLKAPELAWRRAGYTRTGRLPRESQKKRN